MHTIILKEIFYLRDYEYISSDRENERIHVCDIFQIDSVTLWKCKAFRFQLFKHSFVSFKVTLGLHSELQ